MAAELNARQDRHGTIAFTLPISCQICLGKVKQPVLCPSNHVFCSQCMNVWLQRNKQCPACRTPINPGNPVKKILGGLSHQEDDKDKMSNPDLRKARFDLLFREYEDEFERLNSEVQLLRTENDALRQQLQKESSSKSGQKDKYGVQSAKTTETNGLLMLTKKLQDAQKLYEKVKTELAKHKEENNSLKDENVNLNRENQRLRVEISNRSPQRYGRTTVATLETKIQSYEKEVGQLNKALEKSDKYIEDLQKELQECKQNNKSVTSSTGNTDYLSNYSSKSIRDSKESYSTARSSIDSRSSLYGVSADHPSKRQLFNGNDMDTTGKDGVSTGRKSYVNGDLISDKEGASSGRMDYVNGDLYKHDYKGTNMYSSGRREYGSSKSSKYDADDDEDDDYYKSRDSTSKSRGGKSGSKNGKRVTFDIPKDRNETTSFDLEMPSPVKSTSLNRSLNGTSPSPVKSVLKNGKKSKYGSSDSLNLSKPSSLGDSFNTDRGSSRKYSKDDSDLIHSQSMTYTRNDDLIARSRSSGADYYSDKRLNDSFHLEQPERKSGRYRDNLDDTQTIESELDELNISVTPDFTDCIKLLNRAEKKVHDHAEPYGDSDPLYGTYKSQDYLEDYPSTKDTLSADYKSRDPLLSDFTLSSAATRTNNYSKSENTYTADYPQSSGNVNSYKSSYSAVNDNGEFTRSSYPPSSVDGRVRDYPSMYSSSRTNTDIPGSQYSAASSAGGLSTYTTSSVEGLNRNYPSSTVNDNRYNSAAADSTGNYKMGYGKPGSSLDNPVSTTSNLEYSNKYLSASKPLSQSGFGRSPSVDNLFMTKPSHDTGKRYATAEDLPTDYKSRRSLPSYSSAVGDKKGRLSAAAAGSDVGSGASRDYKISALPPKPVRTRSYSDMGTSVSSLPSTHLKGKGSIYSSSNTVDVSSAQTLSDPLDEPHYNMSYSSKYSSLSSANPVAFGDEPNYHDSVSLRFGDGASSVVTLNTNTEPVYSALPPKPKTGYSYTDVDLGVNPRNKSTFGESVSIRGRSASIDLPVSELKSSYDTNEMYSKYSDSKAFISENPDSAYTLSLTGIPSRPGSLDDGYTSTALPSRYSSSSSTAYMPSSLTSVTTSATFSLANPSTSYPSSSMSVTSSAYPMKPLDMIQETSGRGYSYLSNNSSLGDISKSDSFLPEPKKRLFESGDDLDLSLSPIKATRKI